MAIIKLTFPWIKDQYLAIFPDVDFREGGTNYQTIEYFSIIAERNLDNVLEANSKSNLYSLVGDDLVNALLKLGYTRSEGYKAKVRIAIAGEANDFVGESFTIVQDSIEHKATCIAQTISSNLMVLDIETEAPALIVFIDQIEVQYTGSLPVESLQKIAVTFQGRLRESEQEYRDRVFESALLPNRFKLDSFYENKYYYPFPEIVYLQDGEYNLFFPERQTDLDRLFFIYLGLNNTTPTRSTQTETFIEEDIKLTSDITVKFGYNIYGEVIMQMLVYLKKGATQGDMDKITEVLRSYPLTPTLDNPIYSDDIIRDLESVGIYTVSNISFFYNTITNLQLSFQDKKIFKLDDVTPIIFQSS